MQQLKVAIAQINPSVGAINDNLLKIQAYLKESSSDRPDLVVFPEMTLTGYPVEDLLYNKSFVGSNLKALRELAAKSGNPPFIVGFVDRSADGRLYNAAAFIRNRKIEYVYHKCSLPNYGVFDERRYFAPGTQQGVFSYSPKIKIGLSICEDMWDRNSFLYDREFTQNLSVIVNISASPFHAGKQMSRERLVQDLAKHSGATVVYANLIGGQDELVFDGGSLAVTPDGRYAGRGPLFEEAIIWADVPCRQDDTQKSIKYRMPKLVSAKMSFEEEVYRALVLGTRDYVEKNDFSKVLIGLSGGIDSALVASIACDALGKDRVAGITMPSRYTSKETLKDAATLAANLGIPCHEISIEPLFKAYLESLKPFFKNADHGTAEENLQARIRGNLLMAFSNKWGYLVLTTGNKSEMATGYCTLYGDMAGGFAVIKDVPKTLVFKLARFRNRQTKKPWIPASIIARPPSAELKYDQKDQDTLPPYIVLDEILREHIELDKDASEIVSSKLDKKTVHRVIGLVNRSEYKRRQSPPGIKITPKAFGRDRRMPITNQFRSR